MSTEIGNRVRQFRESAGISQEGLAAAAGYKRAATLSQIETGGRVPTPAKLEKLARGFAALDVKVTMRDLDPHGEAFQREGRPRGRSTAELPAPPTKPPAQPSDTNTGAGQGSSEQTESGMADDPQVDKLVSVFKGLPAADRRAVWQFVLEKELARTRVSRGRTGDRKKRSA